MKKVALSIFIIIINVIGFYFWLIYLPQQNEYSEEVVQKIAKETNKNLAQLIDKIDHQIETIQNDLLVRNMTSESCNGYFLETLSQQPIFKFILFFKDNKKFAIQKEKNSIISACDSSDITNIVKWSRFENKKKISEWDEVFNKQNFYINWIEQLHKSPNKYQWIHHYLPLEKQFLLWLGKSWVNNSHNYSLAIHFSKDEIRKLLKVVEDFKSFNILLQTENEDMLNLVTNKIHITDSSSFKIFTSIINEGITQLDSNENKIFSYMFNNQMYWAVVKNLDSKLGIKRIIINIPDQAILSNANKTQAYGLFYYLLLVALSLLGLFIIFKKSIWRLSLKQNKQNTIHTLLLSEESQYLEFKSSLRWDYRENKINTHLEFVIIKTIAAFGNADGGTLLIGVDDDKKIIGIAKDLQSLKRKDTDYYEIYMRNLFHKYFGVKYTTKNIQIYFVKEKNEDICVVKVAKADEPIYLKTKNKNGETIEKFYVRSGNSSQQIDSMKDINDYIFDRFKKDK